MKMRFAFALLIFAAVAVVLGWLEYTHLSQLCASGREAIAEVVTDSEVTWDRKRRIYATEVIIDDTRTRLPLSSFMEAETRLSLVYDPSALEDTIARDKPFFRDYTLGSKADGFWKLLKRKDPLFTVGAWLVGFAVITSIFLLKSSSREALRQGPAKKNNV